MAWTKATPISTTKVKDSPTIFTGNWAALESWTNVEHYSIASAASGTHLPGKCGVLFVGATAAIAALTSMPACAISFDTTLNVLKYYSGSAWTSIAPSSFASGTKMLFYQDTAPTGWTIANTLDDKVVYVTKGSVAGGQTGGGVHSTGAWTHPDHTHTGPSHTHTGPNHEHTGPNHTHTTPGLPHNKSQEGPPEDFGGGDLCYLAHDASTTGAGGTGVTGAAGTGATGAEGTGATAGGATANTWRPAAYSCIIATKD